MIYISISCLGYDSQLEHTIESAFNNATNPQNVNMGIAFIGDLEFYEKTKKVIRKYSNIKKLFVPYEGNTGIGKGRLLAASMYNEEDYYLQVDSHSHFFEGWDEYLISKLSDAKSYIGHNKIVLSGYLPSYEFIKDKLIADNKLTYPVYQKDQFVIFTIPRWNSVLPEEIDQQFAKIVEETGFAPLNKIMAGFMFGGKELANNLGIKDNLIFWEEEIIQTIELMESGFTLLYPDRYSPIAHRYRNRDTDVKRDNIFDIHKNTEQHMIKNYHLYINNNIEAVDRYEKYVKVSLITGPDKDLSYPEYYINSGIKFGV